MENLDIPGQTFPLSLLGVVIDCFASISYWEYSILIRQVQTSPVPGGIRIWIQGMDEPDGTSRMVGMRPGSCQMDP